jgi:hypothetical protein
VSIWSVYIFQPLSERIFSNSNLTFLWHFPMDFFDKTVLTTATYLEHLEHPEHYICAGFQTDSWMRGQFWTPKELYFPWSLPHDVILDNKGPGAVPSSRGIRQGDPTGRTFGVLSQASTKRYYLKQIRVCNLVRAPIVLLRKFTHAPQGKACYADSTLCSSVS